MIAAMGSVPSPSDPAAARFWARVVRVGDCWLWAGAWNGAGQAYAAWGGRAVPARRVAAYLTTGTWPTDRRRNTCGDRACVNPAHWAPPAGRRPRAPRAPSATCRRGHPWTPANTIVHGRWRRCRACQQAAQRAYHARKRARAAQATVA
jgi:hypothetical protein